jgi:hypothetical protein
MPSRQSFLSAGVEPRFLQGTFEKIHLHCLVGQQPLQLVDLLTQRGFA